MASLRIRVLVVEDSRTVRQRLCEVLATDPEIEVVGEAGDGKRGIELCRELRPDVVSLDMMLPVMTGVAATEYIMAHCPTPILIVSASTNRGELFRTYDALAAGAVDVLEKPRGDDTDRGWEDRYLSSIKLVSRIKVITHLRGRLAPHPPEVSHGAPVGSGSPWPPPPSAPSGSASFAAPRLVALGASTGGPGALVQVLSGLPSGFRPPVLLVLHINEPFGTAFAEWLDGQTSHRVSYARDGEPLGDHQILMAPPGHHLVVHQGRTRLTLDPERHFCRPSVDVLFESVAREYRASAIACLLTGMGRDGAAGLLEVRRAGGATIAQDEATSTVYGMPREAVLLGAAAQVLPLPEIGGQIARLAAATGGRRPP